jgi:homoserine kinase
MSTAFVVRVPASTANLGPAFDCLGLALDLWNETRVEIRGDGLQIEIDREGAEQLPRDESNLVYRSFKRVYDEASQPLPSGLHIHCKHAIPLSSGLGSSAAATLTGLLAANALLENAHKDKHLLQLGAEIEGHADNLAAALHGGLVLVTRDEWQYRAQKLTSALFHAVIVLPEFELSTHEARLVLPQQALLADAVFNMGKSLQVVEAMRQGDLGALADAMEDRLHQPYRLPLIPGATEALAAAKRLGAAAALSGAGPSLIAFCEAAKGKAVAEAMQAAFAAAGLRTRVYTLTSSEAGAEVS